jgi:N-acetylglucosamine-6-sulfatase
MRLFQLRGLSKLVVLGALLVVLVAGQSAPSQAAETQKLNIVFILTDDQSIDSVAKMPFVSSYANWIDFQNAYINDPMCCPSRATIATGLYAHHTHIENNTDRSKFDDSSTVATWLDAAGYRTGLFGKYHLGTHGEPPTYVPPGWDAWASFPDGAYYDYTLNENGHLVQYGSTPQDYSTDVLAAKTINFIKAANGTSPFFAYLATRSPHDGYQPAVRYADAFKNEPIVHTAAFNEPDMSDKPSWWGNLAPRKVQDIDGARRKEYASLLAVDDAVKGIFATLQSKGLLDKTVVVFMTDNSNAFGEHRWRGKGCAYDVCVHTPLLVAYPGQQGRKVNQLVSNVDIAPTFADLAGTAPGSPVDGRSLVPLLTGQAPANSPADVLLRVRHDPTQDPPPRFRAIRTQRYKNHATEGTGEVELYDLSTDPYEVQSVAGQPDYAQVQASLRQRLAALRDAPPHGTNAPETSISAGPNGPTNAVKPTFTFASNEAGSAFQCRVAPAAEWTNCTSPDSLSGLADGPHTFEVRAIDSAGNTDATPATRSFTLDSHAPDTSISAGPNGLTNHEKPTFTFASSEPGAVLQCRVTPGSQWTSCKSPASLGGLPDGSHTFEVRAIDAAGNADATPATRAFTLDTRAPGTRITKRPKASTIDRTPTLRFRVLGGADLDHFECAVDARPFRLCRSPKTIRPRLSFRRHLFRVRAVDRAGIADRTPARAFFKVRLRFR